MIPHQFSPCMQLVDKEGAHLKAVVGYPAVVGAAPVKKTAIALETAAPIGSPSAVSIPLARSPYT